MHKSNVISAEERIDRARATAETNMKNMEIQLRALRLPMLAPALASLLAQYGDTGTLSWYAFDAQLRYQVEVRNADLIMEDNVLVNGEGYHRESRYTIPLTLCPSRSRPWQWLFVYVMETCPFSAEEKDLLRACGKLMVRQARMPDYEVLAC